jgi:hypothetical protein
MTPQEKSQEIIKLCRLAVATNFRGKIADHNPRHAKNCAIICVDQILQVLSSKSVSSEFWIMYYQEVKQEIQQL